MRILFPYSFEGQEDRGLKDRLKQPENLGGVLAWAVEGAMRWYAAPKGLVVPDVLKEGARDVRAELDHVQQWLDEETTQEEDKWTDNASLYQSYENWCKANGVKNPKQSRAFGMTLKAKGYQTGVRARDPKTQSLRWGTVGLRLCS